MTSVSGISVASSRLRFGSGQKGGQAENDESWTEQAIQDAFSRGERDRIPGAALDAFVGYRPDNGTPGIPSRLDRDTLEFKDLQDIRRTNKGFIALQHASMLISMVPLLLSGNPAVTPETIGKEAAKLTALLPHIAGTLAMEGKGESLIRAAGIGLGEMEETASAFTEGIDADEAMRFKLERLSLILHGKIVLLAAGDKVTTSDDVIQVAQMLVETAKRVKISPKHSSGHASDLSFFGGSPSKFRN